MRNLLIVLVVMLLLVTAPGFARDIKVDYERGTDFSKLMTYHWKQGRMLQGPAEMLTNTILVDRIQKNVDTQLAAKGRQRTDEGPVDFFVTFWVGKQDKQEVWSTGMGRGWGYAVGPYWGPGWNDTMVTNYTEGTLIIDIIDATSNHLVWRAYCKDTVGNPEKAEKKIRKAIEKAFKKFPPKK